MVVSRDDTIVYVFTTTPQLGWWVGWVQRGDRSWTFVLNLDITQPEHPAAHDNRPGDPARARSAP